MEDSTYDESLFLGPRLESEEDCVLACAYHHYSNLPDRPVSAGLRIMNRDLVNRARRTLRALRFQARIGTASDRVQLNLLADELEVLISACVAFGKLL
jgi:hypothetical protein